MAGTDGTGTTGPMFDDADRYDVWWRVIDALTDALDTEGMPARDRGALTRLHNSASTWVGKWPLELPRDLVLGEYETVASRDARRELSRAYEVRTGPGGIYTLGLTDSAERALARADFLTIDDLAADLDRVRATPGIGPKSMKTIRAAIESRASVETGAK